MIDIEMTDIEETAVRFGPANNLTGIMSSPSGRERSAVACLLFNVGVTHRVGPRRLNVKLARRLALAGIPSLRFDLSGIGDSSAAPSRRNFREQSILDLQSAMDHVEALTGIRRFVVLGICSGATNGYWLAQADPRVTGLLMFDGFAFPTYKTKLIHDWQRLRTTPPRALLEKLGQRLKRMFGGSPVVKPVSIFTSASDLATPTRDEFQAAMELLVARGVSVYVIYSGSLLLYHNHHAQFSEAFGNAAFLSRVRYAYMPDVDHIATSLVAQKTLLGELCAWVSGQQTA